LKCAHYFYPQVVGFGSTGNIGNETILPSELQQADLPVLSYEKCFQTGNSLTFSSNLIPGENFCAGYKNGTTTCKGDSGGSFSIRVDGRWFLRGITSFGAMKSKSKNYCDDNYSVFLDVTKYIPWIMQNIESLQQIPSNTGFFYCMSNSIKSFFGIKKK
jgi:secreted trypsin-like serine protease